MKNLHIPHIIDEFDSENIVKLNDNFNEIQRIMKQIQEYVQDLPTEMPEVIHGKDGMDGIEGPKGADGLTPEMDDIVAPGLVYRGLYSVGERYYWTNDRRDVVFYDDGVNPRYYLFNVKSSEGVDVVNWYAPQWKEFARYFSSIATGLLLAEDAAITRNLNIGGGTGSGYAGMSGVGHEDWRVRIWAGDLNRYNAPFRVMENGDFFAGSEDNHIHWDGTTLNIKGSILQSDTDSFPAPVYRGEYAALTEYSKGDVVTYDGRTWIYVNDLSSTGNTPADNTYWDIYSEKGDDGAKGDDGSAGPGIVYRGVYASGTYYYTTVRRDVVKYNDGSGDSYYLYNKPGTNSETTWNSSNWTSFGATFHSVATGLLLAEDAIITKALQIGSATGSNYTVITGDPVTVVGGTFAPTGDAIMWAGSTDAAQAPFRLHNDGQLMSKKPYCYGDNGYSSVSLNGGYASGQQSIAIGYLSTATGGSSVSVGHYSQTNHTNSTAIGGLSKANNADATALGRSSTAGAYGTATGYNAITGNSYSVANGQNANANADRATAIGSSAAATNYGSVAVGRSSVASGQQSTALGFVANAGHINSVALGNGAVTTANNEVMIGNANLNTIKSTAEFILLPSDERDKIDIQACNHGLDFILNLEPIKFRLDPRTRYEGKKDGSKANKEHSFGFSAQQVLKLQEGTDINIARDFSDNALGINMTGFIPMLVNSVKELKAENDSLRENQKNLEERLKSLEAKVL